MTLGFLRFRLCIFTLRPNPPLGGSLRPGSPHRAVFFPTIRCRRRETSPKIVVPTPFRFDVSAFSSSIRRGEERAVQSPDLEPVPESCGTGILPVCSRVGSPCRTRCWDRLLCAPPGAERLARHHESTHSDGEGSPFALLDSCSPGRRKRWGGSVMARPRRAAAPRSARGAARR